MPLGKLKKNIITASFILELFEPFNNVQRNIVIFILAQLIKLLKSPQFNFNIYFNRRKPVGYGRKQGATSGNNPDDDWSLGLCGRQWRSPTFRTRSQEPCLGRPSRVDVEIATHPHT